jgi:thiamine-phosphate pyrophosphorylase
VYLVTDRYFSIGRSTPDIVKAAIRGGISVVQIREKDLSTRDFYTEAAQIRELLRSAGIPLIINDRIDVALAVDADGVHLGQDDMSVKIARKILGPDRIIGLSLNQLDNINDEAFTFADYLAVSPVFPTATKLDTAAAWGLGGLRRARQLTDMPLIAIGSIKNDNAREVIMAGADCVAVVTAIVAAEDPEKATCTLVETVREAKKASDR